MMAEPGSFSECGGQKGQVLLFREVKASQIERRQLPRHRGVDKHSEEPGINLVEPSGDERDGMGEGHQK